MLLFGRLCESACGVRSTWRQARPAFVKDTCVLMRLTCMDVVGSMSVMSYDAVLYQTNLVQRILGALEILMSPHWRAQY